MKTKYQILRAIVALTLILGVSFSSSELTAQSKDPNQTILVYFTEGIDRGPLTGEDRRAAMVQSSSIQNVLARFNISEEQIESAFPTFHEADTLITTSEGKVVKQANMARIFSIEVPEGTDRQHVIRDLQ